MFGIDINLSKEIFTWEKFKQSLRIYLFAILFSLSIQIILALFIYCIICCSFNKLVADIFLFSIDEKTISNILILNLIDYFILYYALFIKEYRKHYIKFIADKKPNLLNKNFIKSYLLHFFISLPLKVTTLIFYEISFGLLILGTIIGDFFLNHIFLHSGLFGLKITEKPKNSLEAI